MKTHFTLEPFGRSGFCLVAVAMMLCFATVVTGAAPVIRSDLPNTVTFASQPAKFVRFVIHASSANQPCIDELELYDTDGKLNFAGAERGAIATASSSLAGYAQHTIEHLNDGRYGNDFSWIAAGSPTGSSAEWAQIELPEATVVSKVVFSRDRKRQYADRVPIEFEVLLSMDGESWKTVKRVTGTLADIVVHSPGGSGGNVPPPPPPPQLDGARVAHTDSKVDEQLCDAILAEEHAWLKTFGRADLSPRLVPYNGRVKQYPHHVGDDSLPLSTLVDTPVIDGRIDDVCWTRASRGVARVASPYDFEHGPLVETAVTAGHHGDSLYLAITTNQLLSSHVAVIASGDGGGIGVLRLADGRFLFETYANDGALQKSTPLAGAANESLTCFEVRLPLELFPDCRSRGLRIGLGMGGQHTPPQGRTVHFTFSSLAIAELGHAASGTFRVRLSSAPGGEPVQLSASAPGFEKGITLAPGETREVSVDGQGPIGAEYGLTVHETNGERYLLHLLRYDPLERTLALMTEMVERFASLERDVAAERDELATLRRRQQELQSVVTPDTPAERRALYDARLAKRRLFFRDPDLQAIERILFVKRHAFEPSHNYSVLLDSPYRAGGGVYVLNIPQRDGRFEPAQAQLERLFDSGGGIARNPTANFDLTKVYFGYRPSVDGYFHIREMNTDGSDVNQITDGPFHDYWPCPLPDGGLAFISTRCRARFICWRPQAAVLFRMDARGEDIRPLSFANLSEWGPSVMSDGRIIWQRSEYVDKGADFSHTLWAVRPDGSHPELVFGNDIIQPNGYANGREVPGTSEFLCTLVSHFGDLNGPLALVDPARSRFSEQAITTLTPEVPWPGNWPQEECFRDGVPLSRDYFLCSHAPRDQFGIYVIDRFGNRELLYLDPKIGSMCPTPFRVQPTPPVLSGKAEQADAPGELFLADVYQGLEHSVERGSVKYLQISQELRADLDQMPDGTYRNDHPEFQDWYATPIHKVSGPFGWPSYVAKATLGTVPVEEDGSARFLAPSGKVLYFQALDEEFNELQRMRSVVQLQAGEKRSCIGCHESRSAAPPARPALALQHPPRQLEPPPWGAGPFSYETVVQPVWDKHCVSCHNSTDKRKLDFTATLDVDKVPASYRTLISQGWVHYLDCGWNSGGNEKREPLTFGTVKSKLWGVLDAGHYDVALTAEEKRRIKCWTDLNCPLWPDYTFRGDRPSIPPRLTQGTSPQFLERAIAE